MPEAKINGAEIYYQDQGEGFPIVFTHGLGGDHTNWVAQVQEFCKKYRVITWDVRGHGRSEVTGDGYSIDRFVEDLHGLLCLLGVERAHVAGLSMGGWISWVYALAHPENTAALVLSDSAGMQAGMTAEQMKQKRDMFLLSADIAEKEGRAGLADTSVSLMFSPEFIQNSPEAVEVVKKRISADPGIGYARTIKNIFAPFWDTPHEEINAMLSAIKAPCLIVCGDKDQLTPLPTQQALHKAIPGSRLEVIPGAGHVPTIEAAGTWNRLVMDFLEQVEE